MGVKNIAVFAEFIKTGKLIIDNGLIYRVYQNKICRAENKLQNNYLQVQIFKNKKRYTCTAHDLVWCVANGDLPEKHTIHHKNGIKTDNRLENLECLSYHNHNTIHAKDRTPWVIGKTDSEMKIWHNKTITSKVLNYKKRAIEIYYMFHSLGISAIDIGELMGVTSRQIYTSLNDCVDRGWLDNGENNLVQWKILCA